MAQVMNIHTPQAADGFRSHYSMRLSFVDKNSLLSFHLPHRAEPNRLSLVPLDDLELTDTSGTWSSGSFKMEYRVQASIMPCSQIMMNELISMLLVRGNHWMVIGCLVSEIALVCGCGELAVHFYTSVPELKCILWCRGLLLLPLLSQYFGKEK